MPTYVSLLRGINVSGQKIIKMDRLRQAYEALNFKEAKTYVQSGNVIFSSPMKDTSKIAVVIQEMILEEFGYPVSVIIRSSEEINKTMIANPFLKKSAVDVSNLYVAFLSKMPAKDNLKRLERFAANSELFCHIGRELYLYCPNGYGRTKLTNNAIEKTLSVIATIRNWNTVNKLCEMVLL